MTTPLIIEVAVNGASTRDEHPGVPIVDADILAQARACAAQGASVIHVHGRKPDGGWAFGDADAYRAVFRELHGRDGLVVYPTMLGSTGDPAARFAHVDALGSEGLIDWAPVDCGTTHFIGVKDGRLAASGFAYHNPVEDSRHALALCVRHRLAPSVAVYEPNFVRQLLLLTAEVPELRPPVVRFMFGGRRLPFGFPPEPVYLDAYLHLLRDHPRLPWMVACYGDDVLPLVEHAIARGGHVRVGLEDDASVPARGNVERVREVAEIARRLGRPVATPEQTRAATGG
ncbi:MAG TPA: 3-keto-5-aminohexanoate cleavage protein [Candidatus Binatia bacterium]|nr:3-keto-5-aminohexanoate cleavage protein [Candidatus Binatia bacterium]